MGVEDPGVVPLRHVVVVINVEGPTVRVNSFLPTFKNIKKMLLIYGCILHLNELLECNRHIFLKKPILRHSCFCNTFGPVFLNSAIRDLFLTFSGHFRLHLKKVVFSVAVGAGGLTTKSS